MGFVDILLHISYSNITEGRNTKLCYVNSNVFGIPQELVIWRVIGAWACDNIKIFLSLLLGNFFT